MTTNTQNIFQEGCLIQLTTSVWGGIKKIPKDLVKEMSGNDSSWIKASKNLVDPEQLNPIKKIVSRARVYLKQTALPFPIDGFCFIPRESIEYTNDRLEEFRNEFNLAINNFIPMYPEYRDNAKNILGRFFNPLDYPENIDRKFDFSWRFVNLELPRSNGANILSPELYKREKEKLLKTVEECRKMSIEALRTEFMELTDHLVDRLTPDEDMNEKGFRESTVTNFFEFIESFKKKNIFEDDDFKEVLNKAVSILKTVGYSNLKDHGILREKVKNDFSKIKEEVTGMIIKKPKRLLTLD